MDSLKEKEINDRIKEFLEYYDYNVPNPEHEPIRFNHYLKLFRYYKSIREGNQNEQSRA